jgi:hypothetical protein
VGKMHTQQVQKEETVVLMHLFIFVLFDCKTSGNFVFDTILDGHHDNLWIILERLDEARIGLSMLKR